VQLTLTPAQLARLGEFSGMAFLAKNDAPAGQPLVVTTSKFFASLLAQAEGLSPEALRPVGSGSEFDDFVAFLAKTPPPASFTVPEGWTLQEQPR
jgi:hypothetical protein